jgi:hypothetical protein
MKTLKKCFADGNNGNSDENDGGGEEVGVEDGKKEKFPRPSVANLIQPSPVESAKEARILACRLDKRLF